MFDLEQAITTWRKQLSTAGIKRADLAELESHLRDHVLEEIRRGLTPERAFAAAIAALGQPKVLSREFASATRVRQPRELLLLTLCALATAGVLCLGGAAAFFCYTSPVDRVVMTLAVLCTVAVALMGRRFARFVPAIPGLKKRLLAILLGAGAFFGLATIYCQLIAHHLPGPAEGFLPAVGYFCMVPTALGFCLILAFEHAASRATHAS